MIVAPLKMNQPTGVADLTAPEYGAYALLRDHIKDIKFVRGKLGRLPMTFLMRLGGDQAALVGALITDEDLFDHVTLPADHPDFDFWS